MFNDLREFIKKTEELGDCQVVEGADWDTELGLITEWGGPKSPLLLFDKIKGYPAGYRVATNVYKTNRRAALGLGLPPEAKKIDQVKLWRQKMASFKPIPPVKVKSGPVMENVHLGDDVDLFTFPVPRWLPLDGGRYIGTGDVVITKDPDEGWVNLGTYRVEVHNKNTATVYMSPGRHSDIMRKKYWARGQSCPVAVCCGQEPMVFAESCVGPGWGLSEYDSAGGLKGKPIEVVEGVVTGLPIPATAELVLEGELLPPGVEDQSEGPFAEWTGYYASGSRNEPAFKVKAILHRNNPIIQGRGTIGSDLRRAGTLWDILNRQITGVKGAWILEGARSFSGLVISLEQKYSGHAMQAALTAAGCRLSYMLRIVIVVDEDIDPTETLEVMWALGTRCDAENSIHVIRGCWGSPLDPSLPPDKRARHQFDHSMAVILACKPYYWLKEFPAATKSSPEVIEKIKEKWEAVFRT